MTNIEDLSLQIGSIRVDVLFTIRHIRELKTRLELPDPEITTLFDDYKKLLATLGVRRVAVVGEVKRGKSSFLNAIISENVLPVYEDVATSLVFLVKQDQDTNQANIRFENGELQQIAFDMEELAKYGSQATVNAHDNLNSGKPIRWVEIDIDKKFFMSNVEIMDTPGLGSIYPQHSFITHRILRGVDAVIYVIDSDAPLNQAEVDEIEKILDKTNNIFFLITKIDRTSFDHWQTIKTRSEAILKDEFGDKLQSYKFHPVSSVLYQKSSNTDNEKVRKKLLERSKFDNVKIALEAFLLTSHEWVTVTSAASDLCLYAMQMESILLQRINSIEEPESSENVIKEAIQQKKVFSTDWGTKGQKRINIQNNLINAVKRGKQRVRDFLKSSGVLVRKIDMKVDEMQSTSDISAFQENLHEFILAVFNEYFDTVVQETHEECTKYVSEVNSVTQKLLLPSKGLNISLPSSSTYTGNTGDLMNTLSRARNGAFSLSFLVNMGLRLVFSFRSDEDRDRKQEGNIIKRATAMAAAFGAMWGAVDNKQKQFEKAKSETKKYAKELVIDLKNHLENKDEPGSMGYIEDTFSEIYQQYQSQLNETLIARETSINVRIQALNNDQKEKINNYSNLINKRRQEYNEWKNIREKLETILNDLSVIHTTLESHQS